MIDITITSTSIQFINGVINVDSSYLGYDLVDELSLHLITGEGVYLSNVDDCIYNGLSFANSNDLSLYLNNF